MRPPSPSFLFFFCENEEERKKEEDRQQEEQSCKERKTIVHENTCSLRKDDRDPRKTLV